MRILYQWDNCDCLCNTECCAFLIEVHKQEITERIKSIMIQKDLLRIENGNYYSKCNQWVKVNPSLANYDCIYLLVSSDLKYAKLEEPFFPYSSQWNAWCPLIYMHGINFTDIDSLLDIEKCIFMSGIEYFTKARGLFKKLSLQGVFSRSENYISEIGQYHVLKYLELQGKKPRVTHKKAYMFDLVVDGKKISVKTEMKTETDWFKREYGSNLRLVDKEWDFLYAVDLRQDMVPEDIAAIPYDELIEKKEIKDRIEKIKNDQARDSIRFKWWGWLNDYKIDIGKLRTFLYDNEFWHV